LIQTQKYKLGRSSYKKYTPVKLATTAVGLKLNNLTVFGSNKLKGLNRITKIG
jgi:hypothetical protein